MNLRRRYILIFAGFALVVSLGGGWLAWTLTSGALERELEEKLMWVAGAAAEAGFDGNILLALSQPADSLELSFTMHEARLHAIQEYVDEAYIFRRNNTVLVATTPPTELPIGTSLSWLDAYADELETAWSTGEAVTPAFVGEDGRPYKYAFKRLEETGAMLGVLMRADYLQPLEQLRRTLVMGTLLSVLFGVLLAALLATNIVRPLERMARSALRIQRGRWDEPVTIERGDELGRLSRAMERMRKGVIQRDEQLRLMLAQVAHEIRNPLGGLELFASAALETDDREERLRLLDRVRREVEGLNAIINNFLTFAKPLHSERRLHDLRDPLQEAAEILSLQLEEKGVSLVMHLPDEPLMARADTDHVKRVALNLMQNAAQAGTQVRVAAWWRNGEAVVSVQDDGPGVASELRDRIFQPFVTDKEQGAGLGLAIVHRVLESNGGRVELVSDQNSDPDPYPPMGGEAGAEFRFYLSGSDELPPVSETAL
ncbi:MAG: HAMP domain-containing sensor histidine kinase [Gemmatimonadota bacterium]